MKAYFSKLNLKRTLTLTLAVGIFLGAVLVSSPFFIEAQTSETESDEAQASAAKPDIAITNGPYISFGEAVAGQEMKFSVDFKNIGNADAGAFTVEYRFLPSHNRLSSARVAKMNKGWTNTVESVGWTPVNPGNYTLRATVDVNQEIDESNENNNIQDFHFTVAESSGGGGGGGDLNPPACPIPNAPDRTIINFSDGDFVLSSGPESDGRTREYSANIPAGKYKIQLTSYDNHFDKSGQGQNKEQYFVRFLNSGGNKIIDSGSISDLPDNKEVLTEVVNNELSISQGVTSVFAQHSHWPSSGKESIVPVCIALDKIPNPPSEKADVSIEKLVTPSSAEVGGEFTYTLRYRNLGQKVAENTTIVDIYSPTGRLSNLQIVNQPNHGTCSVLSNGIECNLGNLPIGSSGSLKYRATGASTGDVDNTARIETKTEETDLSNNEDNARVTITSTPPPASCDAFSASPSTIDQGDSSTLSWNTSNATSVSINQGIGSVSGDGTQSVSPSQTTTYTLTATNTQGSDTCQATVTVQTSPNLPQCTLNANPSVVTPGGSTTLEWTTTNATSASIDQGVGSVTPVSGGSETVSNITSNTTYTMTAVGPGGSITCDAPVTVSTTPLADVSITKSVDDDRKRQGKIFTYTLSYANNGNLDAQNVTIEDTPSPPGILTGFNIINGPSHGTCSAKTNGIECDLGELAVGESGTIKYKATGSEVGNVDNTAVIETTTNETTLSNNQDDERVTIFVPENPPCTVNCGGGGQDPPRVVLFQKPFSPEPLASQSFVYLSQIPYTGLGPNAQNTIVTILIALASIYLSYLFVQKNLLARMFGVVFASKGNKNNNHSSQEKNPRINKNEESREMYSIGGALEIADVIDSRNTDYGMEDDRAEGAQISRSKNSKDTPNNLPTERASHKSEELSQESKDREKSGKALSTEVKNKLADSAKSKGALVSDDALNLVSVAAAALKRDEVETLDELVQASKKVYPREDDYIILDSDRAQKILFSIETGMVQMFVDWLAEGESKSAFEFIRLLRNHGVSIDSFIKRIVYYIDNFYRCQIGEVVDDNHQKLGLEDKNYCWSGEDLQKIVSILVNAVDESYEVQDAPIKLALIKIVEITQGAKNRKGYY